MHFPPFTKTSFNQSSTRVICCHLTSWLEKFFLKSNVERQDLERQERMKHYCSKGGNLELEDIKV
jgi:hypothetical protein